MKVHKITVNIISIYLLLVMSGTLCAASYELHHGPPMYGTTIKKYTAVYDAPSDKSRLIGYVPGAMRVWVGIDQEINNWVPVGIAWKYSEKLWMPRNSIGLANDYRPFIKEWPLEYIKFISEVGNFVWVFPEGNDCSRADIGELEDRISQQTKILKENVLCQELWWVPNTNILYANPHGEDIDIWYESNTQKIRINSIASEYIYGYRTGKSKLIDNFCMPGIDVGCSIYSKITPPQKEDLKLKKGDAH